MARIRLALNEAKKINEKMKIPIDLHKICESKSITVEYSDKLSNDLSGFYINRNNKFPIIVINNKNSEQRQRFTLAHELGHVIMHSFNGVWYDLTQPELVYTRAEIVLPETKDIEMEANIFASELLIPEKQIKQDFKIDRDPTSLAYVYNVSQLAMHFRLKNLGLI